MPAERLTASVSGPTIVVCCMHWRATWRTRLDGFVVSINLAFSLLFGLGQLVLGLLFVRRILARGAWRAPKWFLLLVIAAWFAMSGVTELFVSGMEVSRSITGHPAARSFGVWRGRADTILAIYSALLLAALVGFALRWRFSSVDRRA